MTRKFGSLTIQHFTEELKAREDAQVDMRDRCADMVQRLVDLNSDIPIISRSDSWLEALRDTAKKMRGLKPR